MNLILKCCDWYCGNLDLLRCYLFAGSGYIQVDAPYLFN